ncbi:hypothetical protein EVAR_74561_1 [Eumeta japonica]|uniref:Uncharacterized protein n=1 Tax=Eumeta variegata TaxID=151549 RepID=A0A4C1TEQ6_EUMVA|nr:hypothetical protein EVAR_74561_1 [Eumeta japonica]
MQITELLQNREFSIKNKFLMLNIYRRRVNRIVGVATLAVATGRHAILGRPVTAHIFFNSRFANVVTSSDFVLFTATMTVRVLCIRSDAKKKLAILSRAPADALAGSRRVFAQQTAPARASGSCAPPFGGYLSLATRVRVKCKYFLEYRDICCGARFVGPAHISRGCCLIMTNRKGFVE